MRLFYTFLFSILGFSIFAQVYGNEWIKYDQKYYSFKIYEDGVYRIDYETLQANGISTSQFSSSNMQLFGRDKEQAIYVVDGGDNQFNPGDYFLFYAKKNDGWLDSTLFRNPSDIGNPGVSLFNDTIHYFFTWNNSNNNLRFTNEVITGYQNVMKSQYYMDEIIFAPTAAFNPAKVSAFDPSSLFDPGEGFCNGIYDGATSGYIFDYNFDLSNIYTDLAAPQSILHVKTSSHSWASLEGPTDFNHHLRLSQGNSVLMDTMFVGYQHTILDTLLDNTFLQNNPTFRFEILNDLLVAADRQSLNYISLKYPKKTNLNGTAFDLVKVKNNVFASKVRLDLENSQALVNPLILVLNPTPKFVNTERVDNVLHAQFSNSNNGQDQEVLIQDFSAIKTISSLKAVNGTGNFTDFTTKDFNEANLIIYHTKLQQASNDYISYRSQSYNVVSANIEELYLQFGGGIEKHSNAIRRFAHYAYNKSTSKPIAITILGKGLRYDYTRSNPLNFQNSWIPPFGSPGSDIFYTSFLQGNSYSPLIPIGRISVNNNQDLSDYLIKLKDYESEQNQSSVYNSETKDWQKQILHFVGGSDATQVALFTDYLNICKRDLEDTLFAGNVTTFRKFTSDPLDPTLVDQIGEYIRNGASILNFFGHSGALGFDISVDDPTLWGNYKKYPVILGNGCHAAAIYETFSDYAFSEKIIETANNGGIAYFASGATEYDVTLKQYTQELCKQISYKNYGKYFAKQIKEAIANLENSQFTGDRERFHSTFGATNLNGDPLLKVNYHNKPEIEISEQTVFFEPNQITLQNDSINLNIVLTNLGQSIKDTFYVEIDRNFPLSSIDSNYFVKVPKLNYKDTITLKLPLQPNISVGLNNFDINVDLPSIISEQYDETNNNRLSKIFYLKVNGILPVLPYEFAVVPYDTVTLIASTINPIAGTNTYFFELDTTDLFNSPMLRKKTVSGLGGVKKVHWSEWMDQTGLSLKPLENIVDSTVFFWRVAVDSTILSWNESTFQFIKGKEGWGQDHFFQFKNNNFFNIDYKKEERKKLFKPENGILNCTVWDSPQSNTQFLQTKYDVNSLGDYYACDGSQASIHLAVIDPITLKPWFTNCSTDLGYSFGQANDNCQCVWWRPTNYFIFRQNTEGLNLLHDVIQNQIPEGHYILMYTIGTATFETWPSQFLNMFQTMGSQLINNQAPNRAFIFFTQKGNNDFTKEIMASTFNEFIALNTVIVGSSFQGNEKTKVIGPAKEWKTIYWKQDPLEPELGDTTLLKITGYNYATNTSTTLDYEFTRNDSIINFNSLINANLFPYLTLEARYKDKENITPARLDRWHVLYSPVPEAAIDNSNPYTLSPAFDTINEGQRFIFAADYKNISNLHMDSMLVKYWIEDANNNRHYLNYPRQDSLRVSQTFRDTIEINTTGFSGLNSLWMEINPYLDENQTIPDQLEQHHFNNILQIPFYVKGDDINPILDVTFDGRHILNRDIVNPKSQIVITLKDENPYLIMDDISDTTLFGIFLTEPNGIQKRIPFMDQNGNEILQWIPADVKTKRFKIIFNANFEKDGIYLLNVQGTDRSGNVSGDLDYKISFEVINESSITYLMNYPNPFSTSTKFVFTLTGSEVPDDIIIQIMTVTGKVVREITEDEIGPIYIGRNVTQFSWNGTDEFGDPLANGVYLYRVLSQLDGEKIKHRSTGADKYFKKEFGKMYLMR